MATGQITSRPRGSIEERRPGVWRLRAEIPADPVTGKRRRAVRTVKVKGKRQAQDKLADFLAELARDGPMPTASDLTVGEALERWYVGFRQMADTGAKSVNTATTDREFLDAYVLPHIGTIKLAKLTAFDLDRLYAKLLATGSRRGAPLKPATVRKAHGLIRRALAQCVRWRWITVNPALSATPPSVPQESIAPPEPEAARRILAEAERVDPEWATYLRLAATAGARRSEMCALRRNDVDLEAGTVSITRALALTPDSLVVERQRPKSGRGFRQVAVDAGTVAALAAQLERQERRAVAVRRPLADNCFVFSADPLGAVPWTPSVVTHRFVRLRDRLGLQVRLHDLRHYVATQLLASGGDVRTVAGRLGQDPAVTLRIYAAFVPAQDRVAADIMGRLLD